MSELKGAVVLVEPTDDQPGVVLGLHEDGSVMWGHTVTNREEADNGEEDDPSATHYKPDTSTADSTAPTPTQEH